MVDDLRKFRFVFSRERKVTHDVEATQWVIYKQQGTVFHRETPGRPLHLLTRWTPSIFSSRHIFTHCGPIFHSNIKSCTSKETEQTWLEVQRTQKYLCSMTKLETIKERTHFWLFIWQKQKQESTCAFLQVPTDVIKTGKQKVTLRTIQFYYLQFQVVSILVFLNRLQFNQKVPEFLTYGCWPQLTDLRFCWGEQHFWFLIDSGKHFILLLNFKGDL